MSARIYLGKSLIQLGNFIKSLSVVMMKPGDLVELGRQSYLKGDSIENFNCKELLDQGLRNYELNFLEKIPHKTGKILVLGAGGGRESLFFARHGYDVTAMDFVEEMVANTLKNAEESGFQMKGVVRELTELNLPENSFDIVWLSSGMYSSVPSRKKRIQMLKGIKQILKDDGYFSCQFHWDAVKKYSQSRRIVMKIFAILFLGNFSYEPGDVLWGYKEFIHLFSSLETLRSEFEAGGFRVLDIDVSRGEIIGGALLQK